MTTENAHFITEFIDAGGNECGSLDAYAYSNAQSGIDNVFHYIKGGEEWFVTFSNGVFLPDESYYSKNESITMLDKPPESFVLPAFTRTQVTSYDVNGDIFYAPLRLMAYRGGWYSLISVESNSANCEFVTNEQFVDMTCLLEQAIELNRIKSEFALRIINVPTLTQLALEPWQYYDFYKVESLTLELAEADFQFVDFLPEYSFTFISGDTPTVLTLPSSVQWANELTIEANKRYQISIVDNIGLWCAVDYTAEVSE